jgi:hypothetical protein
MGSREVLPILVLLLTALLEPHPPSANAIIAGTA